MAAQQRKSTTLKAPAQTIPVPQSHAAAAVAILDIGRAQRERTRIEAAMNDEIAAVKERAEAQAKPYNDEIQRLRTGLQIYCEAHRDELTDGRKQKTGTFSTGVVRWRMTPPAVTVRAAKETIQALIKAGYQRFVRVKEEVNKEAILAEIDIAQQLPRGISISQREEFVIVPFETTLEEVV